MKRLFESILLIALLLFCAGFTIGLTYAPCYSSLCVEEFFPYTARLHLASFYAIVAGAACLLFLRAYSPKVRRVSEYYLVRRELPIIKKRISVGGLFITVFLIVPALAITAFWVQPTIDHWITRAESAESPNADTVKVQLVATGITAHHVDILLGMLLIPVSRNSLLGRVFGVHQSTLLYSHKLLSYFTFVAALAHGIVSLIFLGTWNAAPQEDSVREVFDVYNPTLSVAEAKSRGPWSLAVLPTGVILLVLFVAIVTTSLPVVRRRSYNAFYYSHIFCIVAILVCSSIHASTNFYCILPGLLLWVGDLVWRQIRGYSGLSKSVIGKLEAAESGWYRLALPVAAKQVSITDTEKAPNIATHPIQSYYFIFPAISKLQNHAFTAASVGNADEGPIFLLQRATGKQQKKLDKEWTWKLGAMADASSKALDVQVRVEGPYAPSVSELWTASDIICVVGGTGLTGAYSLALWWIEHRSRATKSSFTLIWTIRHAETAQLREWLQLEMIVNGIENMSLFLQITSEQGRLNANSVLRSALSDAEQSSQDLVGGDVPTIEDRRAWVYISGPEGLLSSVESACIEMQQDIKRARKQNTNLLHLERLNFYSAKWEV